MKNHFNYSFELNSLFNLCKGFGLIFFPLIQFNESKKSYLNTGALLLLFSIF